MGCVKLCILFFVCGKIYLKFTIFAILSVVSSVALSTVDPLNNTCLNRVGPRICGFFSINMLEKFWRFATI